METPINKIITLKDEMHEKIINIINEYQAQVSEITADVMNNLTTYHQGDILLAFRNISYFRSDSPRKYFPVLCSGIRSVKDNTENILDFVYKNNQNQDGFVSRFHSDDLSNNKVVSVLYDVQKIYRSSGNVSVPGNKFNYIDDRYIIKKLGTVKEFDTPEKIKALYGEVLTLNSGNDQYLIDFNVTVQ